MGSGKIMIEINKTKPIKTLNLYSGIGRGHWEI